MLGNQPAWFGGRLRGKGPTNGHLAAQPTQYGTRQLTLTRFLEICWALGVDGPTMARRALQRARIRLASLTLQVDLNTLLADPGNTYRPMVQWARNTLNEQPSGIVEVEPVVVKNLARFVGCSQRELTNYLARYLPDEEKIIDWSRPQ